MAPERQRRFVAGFPAQEHSAGFRPKLAVFVEIGIFKPFKKLGFVLAFLAFGCKNVRAFSGLPGFVFFLKFLFKQHVPAPDKMVAFDASAFRRCAFCIFLPGQHAFADCDAPVVDDLHPRDFTAGRFQDFIRRPSQQDVPDMPKVQGFIGVGG